MVTKFNGVFSDFYSCFGLNKNTTKHAAATLQLKKAKSLWIRCAIPTEKNNKKNFIQIQTIIHTFSLWSMKSNGYFFNYPLNLFSPKKNRNCTFCFQRFILSVCHTERFSLVLNCLKWNEFFPWNFFERRSIWIKYEILEVFVSFFWAFS